MGGKNAVRRADGTDRQKGTDAKRECERHPRILQVSLVNDWPVSSRTQLVEDVVPDLALIGKRKKRRKEGRREKGREREEEEGRKKKERRPRGREKGRGTPNAPSL